MFKERDEIFIKHWPVSGILQMGDAFRGDF